MNIWAAPLTVFLIGATAFLTIGEPFGVVLVGIISALGYSINKAASR